MVSAHRATPTAGAGQAGEAADSVEPAGAVRRRDSARERSDPLGPILSLGRPQSGVGFAVGLAGALFVHGAAAATGFERLFELEAFADRVQSDVVEYLRAQYDVELEEPLEEPPPPPPPPAPEPEPVPEPESQPVAREDQAAAAPQAAPPEAAQAAAALTAEPEPDKPLDLTGEAFTIVTGGGDRYAGGQTQRDGTSQQPVYDTRARARGVRGSVGSGEARAVAREPAKDLSRPARPLSGANWNSCGFPAEADVEQINTGLVRVMVTVGPDGRAKSVVVQSDSGYGFGAHARQCILRMPFFEPALDRNGKPIAGTTAAFAVRFTR